MNQILLAVLIGAVSSGVTTALIQTDFTYATSGITKTFIFGDDMLDKIDSYTYTNGDPIGIDSNLPSLTIDRYDEINLQDQSKIESYAATHGWVVISSETTP